MIKEKSKKQNELQFQRLMEGKNVSKELVAEERYNLDRIQWKFKNNKGLISYGKKLEYLAKFSNFDVVLVKKEVQDGE